MSADETKKSMLSKTGEQVRKVAKEVREDCDNEVLSNAREFYSGAFKKVKKGLRASVKAAERLSDEEGVPETLQEDLADTGRQLKQVAKEVIEDCDSEVLRGAGEFYAGAVGSLRRGVSAKAEAARVRTEKRKLARAAARRRRAEIRKKLTGKAGAVLVCLILFALLIVSGALWFSQHHGTGKAAQTTTEHSEQTAISERNEETPPSGNTP